jgi:hypothetical protein
MGYRSEVRAAFYTLRREEWPTLKLFVEENFPKGLDEDLHLITSDGMWGYDYNATGIKWYISYPEIQEFETFLKVFEDIANAVQELTTVSGEVYDESANHWAWEFIRIGEEPHDVERRQGGRGNNYPLLNVSMEVVADYETDKEQQ